jgi:transposase-like protein
LFSYEKRIRALELYEQTRSVTETIRILDYPERQTLYKWISEQGQPKKSSQPFEGKTHLRIPGIRQLS